MSFIFLSVLTHSSKGDITGAPLSSRFAGPSTPSHSIVLSKCSTAWLSFLPHSLGCTWRKRRCKSIVSLWSGLWCVFSVGFWKSLLKRVKNNSSDEFIATDEETGRKKLTEGEGGWSSPGLWLTSKPAKNSRTKAEAFYLYLHELVMLVSMQFCFIWK